MQFRDSLSSAPPGSGGQLGQVTSTAVTGNLSSSVQCSLGRVSEPCLSVCLQGQQWAGTLAAPVLFLCPLEATLGVMPALESPWKPWMFSKPGVGVADVPAPTSQWSVCGNKASGQLANVAPACPGARGGSHARVLALSTRTLPSLRPSSGRNACSDRLFFLNAKLTFSSELLVMASSFPERPARSPSACLAARGCSERTGRELFCFSSYFVQKS